MRLNQQIRQDAENKRLTWLEGSLSRQFLLVSTIALLLGMLALGTFVSRIIVKGVVETSAASASLYISSLISPHLQSLATSDALSRGDVAAIQLALEKLASNQQVTSIKVWKQQGLIVYSSNPDLIGRRFPENPFPSKALNGIVSAEYGKLYHREDEAETGNGEPHLEVYAPVTDLKNGAVIAVLEFHERPGTLTTRLDGAKRDTWAATSVVALLMITAMFSIVSEGSRTIEQQKAALTEQIAELSESLKQNKELRRRIQRSARRATAENERAIRQLGYDLHDGVAQLIGLALLRLGTLVPREVDRDNFTKIRKALADALQDVRHLCRGLLLPEIQHMNLRDALLFIASHHEKRTGTPVDCQVADLPEVAPQIVTISLCRFVQEALTNAFRHAQGEGQKLIASSDGMVVAVEVHDTGPGFSQAARSANGGMGLIGLRDRIRSIGGTMSVRTDGGRGTKLIVVVPLSEKEYDVE